MLETRRHDELFDKVDYQRNTWVFGNGGTGSHMGYGLACLGVGQQWSPLHFVDHDHVQPHNVPNQFVTCQQGELGLSKVSSVAENLRLKIPDIHIYTHQLEAPNPLLDEVSGVAILCYDSMDERRKTVETMFIDNRRVECVIDVRMDVPGAIAICFNPNDAFQVGCYFEAWYSDEEMDITLGCDNEHQSIISSILGATALGLQRFEDFAKVGSTRGIINRIDWHFRTGYSNIEYWQEDP